MCYFLDKNLGNKIDASTNLVRIAILHLTLRLTAACRRRGYLFIMGQFTKIAIKSSLPNRLYRSFDLFHSKFIQTDEIHEVSLNFKQQTMI